MKYNDLHSLIIDVLRDSGAEVRVGEEKNYLYVIRENGTYICFITPILNLQNLEKFHLATKGTNHKREIIVCTEIQDNADLKARMYGIDIISPNELYSYIGKYVVNKLLNEQEGLEEKEEEIIDIENLDLDIEAEWEEEGEEEIDGIPIFLEEISEGEESEMYPIIKPSLMNKREVASYLLENGIIYANVPRENIHLQLIPYYIFTFDAKIYVENEESLMPQKGLVCINSLDGSGHILKEGLLTINSLPEVDKRHSPKIDDITAMEYAREIIKREYSREEEITREMGSVTVFEKVKMYPKNIELNLENIFYYPIWKVEMIGREIVVDGVSKKILKSS